MSRKSLSAAASHNEAEDPNALDIFGDAPKKDPGVEKPKPVKIERPAARAAEPKVEPKVEAPSRPPRAESTKMGMFGTDAKQPERRPAEQRVEPVVQVKHEVIKTVDQESIQKILGINKLFLERPKGVQDYIRQFLSAGDLSELIYKSLNTPSHEIQALVTISKMYSQESAERAFFLVSNKNQDLTRIRHQLGRFLLIDEKEIPKECTDENKIDFCRGVEKKISTMTEDEHKISKEISDFLGTVDEQYKI